MNDDAVAILPLEREEKAALRETLLVGRRISPQWLKGSVPTLGVRFSGELASAFAALMEAAKVERCYLPTASLKAALTVGLGSVISIDRDLGLGKTYPNSGLFPCAVTLFSSAAEDSEPLVTTICGYLKSWIIDTVEPWAQRNEMGDLTARLKKAVTPAGVALNQENASLLKSDGSPDFSLIARTLAEKLIGEQLFEGLGSCELVASPEWPSNSVELMTLPTKLPKMAGSFSMVARLTVCTIPYSKDLFLSVSAAKRNWSQRMPGYSAVMRQFTAHVLAPGTPVMQVSVERRDGAWSFGEDYSAAQREAAKSGAALPATVLEAIKQEQFNPDVGWWVGIPELPALSKFLAPRTVFEGDEVELFLGISGFLGPILAPRPIPFQEVSLGRSQTKSIQQMLRLSDLSYGTAGASLAAEYDEDDNAEDDETDRLKRVQTIDDYREQNILAIQAAYGATAPMVWLVGGSPEEQSIIERSVEMLFGDAITIAKETLPLHVHGARASLPAKEASASVRFDERKKAWDPLAETIKKVSAGRPSIVVICAADQYEDANGKLAKDDGVNTFAGIHSMAKVGANAHHLLPISAPGDAAAAQTFLHRAQSALLDVILAHSGVVLAVDKFIGRVLPVSSTAPLAIYGVQAARTRAKRFSGQTGVSFILYSKLVVATGVTEIQIVYCQNGKTNRSKWLPLAKGLQWLGSQRQLSSGDDSWLKNTFVEATKETIAQAAETDPYAIFLIEWRSVSGLWRGIRDTDLTPGTSPRLGDASLGAYPGMSFVRIRKGIDTLSIRSSYKKNVAIWRGDIEHTASDSYYTTLKRLVEIGEGDSETLRAGHFIANMGYAKTVQVLRGLSCYKTTKRLKQDKITKEYQEKFVDPSYMDAALPAPMDITVLQSPEGVSPRQIAMVVMGLRLGYAHYSDWTSMPAPLFFKAKVDDYVMKFSEADSEDDPVKEPSDAPPSPPKQETLLAQVVNQHLREQLPAAREKAEDTQEALLPEINIATSHDSDEEDLLSLAKNLTLVSLIDTEGTDAKLQALYQRMMQEDPAVRVRVDLPYWIKTRGLFGDYTPVVRRNATKCWAYMRSLNYVRSRVQKPHDRDFLDWLAERLQVPQAINALNRGCRKYLGDFRIAPFAEAIDRLYNADRPEAERINTARTVSDVEAGEICKWASSTGNDEMLAWLVFVAACYGTNTIADPILKPIKAIPGPMTMEALKYYVDCATAIEDAIAQKSNLSTFRSVLRRRQRPALPEQDKAPAPIAQPEEALTVAPTPAVEPPCLLPTPQRKPAAIPKTITNTQTVSTGSERVMKIKSELAGLITSLSPGNSAFDATLAQINGNLQELTRLHKDELERQNAAQTEIARMGDLRETYASVLAKYEGFKADFELSDCYAFVEPSASALDDAEDEAMLIEQNVEDVQSLKDDVNKIDSLPPPASFPEREKRARASAETLSKAQDMANALKTRLDTSICLTTGADGAPPPPDGPVDEAPDSEVSPPLAQEPAADAAPNEAAVTAAAMPPPAQPVPPILTKPEKRVDTTPAPIASLIAVPPPPAKASPPQIAPAPIIAPEVAISIPEKAPAVHAVSKSPAVNDPMQSEQESETEACSVLPVSADVCAELDVLVDLFARRYYGLAQAQIEAIKPLMLAMNEDDEDARSTNVHYIVLTALALAMDSMQCKFAFPSTLDSALKEMLEVAPLSNDVLCEAKFTALGALGASLSSMLFSNSDAQWNVGNVIRERLQGHHGLKQLLEHVDTARQRNVTLTRATFRNSGIGDQQTINSELEELSKRAANWKSDNDIHSSWNHRAFRSAHEDIYGASHPVGACLAAIARGDALRARQLFEEARRKLDKPTATLDEAFRKIGEKKNPDGQLRVWSIENLGVTKSFIEDCLTLMERRHSPSKELKQNTESYLSVLHRSLTGAREEILVMDARTPLERLYRDSAAAAIQCALHLYGEDHVEACVGKDQERLLLDLALDRDLMPEIYPADGVPALCDPAETRLEVRRCAAALHSIGQGTGTDTLDDLLADVQRQHIARNRFLPSFHIERLLKRSGSADSISLAYAKAKNKFIADLQEVRQRVTHAMTLNAFPKGAEEANQMLRVVEEMLESLRSDHSIGHINNTTSNYADFPQALHAMQHIVQNPLEKRLKEATDRIEAELQSYYEIHGVKVSSDVQRIRAMLAEKNAASLRTANDALAVLKQQGRLPERMEFQPDHAKAYETFLRDVHQSTAGRKSTLDALREALTAESKDDDFPWLARLSEEQRKDAAAFLESWSSIFSTSKRAVLEESGPLHRLFQQMGLGKAPAPLPENGRPNRTKFFLPERSFTLNLSSDDVFIPPRLGSWATHIEGYVLAGSPQESDLRQLMQDVGSTPVVVIARMRLSMAKRAKLCGGYPVLLLDDDLISYIALHPGERLETMLRIAILTYYTNPYDDYGGRPVPSEMFFGRQRELTLLREVKSLGVLYGGRRLGKSSLLSQIEKETNLTRNSMAVYISMETVDSSGDHVTSAWDFLYRQLTMKKLIPEYTGAMQTGWVATRQWIEKGLAQNSSLNSLYLLIDEADTLMACELRLKNKEVGFIRGLQQLVDNLQDSCHVRYVVAGLHNMARMASDENSVFGKAEQIALEPFNSPDDIQRGIKLITKPLAAMGYLFAKGSEDLPLRILSVCNFYPAFIQLYCKRLVDKLQNDRQEKCPPIYITSDELDVVEKDTFLLTELRRKFELNLNLDKRYKAIALILADVYYSEVESIGHYTGLNLSEIRGACEAYTPMHFRNSGQGVFEALLDEMRKLNVVEKVHTRYILRTPNIAMMMGERESIAHQLDELAREKAEEHRNHGDRRVQLLKGSERGLFFPFPISTVRRFMESSDGELLVITGNSSSGLMELSKLTAGDWFIGNEGIVTALAGSGPYAASEYVNRIRKETGGGRGNSLPRLLLVRPPSWRPDVFAEFISAARKAAAFKIRIALLAIPEQAGELAKAIGEGELETHSGPNGGWRVEPIPCWSDDAVYFRMHENVDVSSNAEAIAALLKASCGYQTPLLQICNANMTVAEAINFAEARKNAFAPTLDVFYKNIGMPSALLQAKGAALQGFTQLVDGYKRNSPDVTDALELQELHQSDAQFLHWMGLLQDGPEGTWKTPDYYSELLSAPSK